MDWKLKWKIDTIYETNNGLDEDDQKYQEYYTCTIKTLNKGGFIEISMQDPSQIIILGDQGDNQKIIFGE